MLHYTHAVNSKRKKKERETPFSSLFFSFVCRYAWLLTALGSVSFCVSLVFSLYFIIITIAIFSLVDTGSVYQFGRLHILKLIYVTVFFSPLCCSACVSVLRKLHR